MLRINKERVALSALFFQSGLCFSTWASRIPDIKEFFNFTDGELGTLLLIRPLGALVGLPLAGIIVDRFGSRFSSTTGTIFFSISLTLIGLADNVFLLAGSLLFFGLSANLINISNNAYALVLQNNYGKVIMASFHGLWSLAGFLGASLGAVMIAQNTTIANHFLLVSCSVLVMLAVSYKHLTAHKEGEGSKKLVFQKPDNKLMKLGGIAFCGLLCEGCMFDWSGVYFRQVINAEEGLIATGYVAFMGMMAFGRFVSDFFTNKFGSKKVIKISGLLIFGGLMMSVLFPFLITGIVGFLMVGAGTSSVIPLTYNEVGKSKIISPGIALAIVSTIGYFGFLLGPPLIGMIAEFLNLRASFALIAIMGLLISLITYFTENKNLNTRLSS